MSIPKLPFHHGLLGAYADFVAETDAAIGGVLEAEEKTLPPVQLFELQADPRETRNLQSEITDVVKRLRARLEAYRASGRSRP